MFLLFSLIESSRKGTRDMEMSWKIAMWFISVTECRVPGNFEYFFRDSWNWNKTFPDPGNWKKMSSGIREIWTKLSGNSGNWTPLPNCRMRFSSGHFLTWKVHHNSLSISQRNLQCNAEQILRHPSIPPYRHTSIELSQTVLVWADTTDLITESFRTYFAYALPVKAF